MIGATAQLVLLVIISAVPTWSAILQTPSEMRQATAAVPKTNEAFLGQPHASLAQSKGAHIALIVVPILLLAAMVGATIWLLMYDNWNVDAAVMQGKSYASKGVASTTGKPIPPQNLSRS